VKRGRTCREGSRALGEGSSLASAVRQPSRARFLPTLTLSQDLYSTRKSRETARIYADVFTVRRQSKAAIPRARSIYACLSLR
jgi:hypothetical protein